MSNETQQRAARRVRNTGPKWVCDQCLPIPDKRGQSWQDVAECFALRLARREYGNHAIAKDVDMSAVMGETAFDVVAYIGKRDRHGVTWGKPIKFRMRLEGGAR